MFLSITLLPSVSLGFSTHCSRRCEGAAVTCSVFLVADAVAVVVLQLCSRMFPSGRRRPASYRPRTFTRTRTRRAGARLPANFRKPNGPRPTTGHPPATGSESERRSARREAADRSARTCAPYRLCLCFFCRRVCVCTRVSLSLPLTLCHCGLTGKSLSRRYGSRTRRDDARPTTVAVTLTTRSATTGDPPLRAPSDGCAQSPGLRSPSCVSLFFLLCSPVSRESRVRASRASTARTWPKRGSGGRAAAVEE